MISNYHYIKWKFNQFVNDKLSHDFWDKMEKNHLNIVTSRWGNRSCLNRVFSDWNNNSSKAELNFNNILNILCNQCGSLDYKSNDCFYKNKICNYCKKKKHLQKVCFKKKCDDRINDVIINKEEDDSDHIFMNVFITFEESYEN